MIGFGKLSDIITQMQLQLVGGKYYILGSKNELKSWKAKMVGGIIFLDKRVRWKLRDNYVTYEISSC